MPTSTKGKTNANKRVAKTRSKVGKKTEASVPQVRATIYRGTRPVRRAGVKATRKTSKPSNHISNTSLRRRRKIAKTVSKAYSPRKDLVFIGLYSLSLVLIGVVIGIIL